MTLPLYKSITNDIFGNPLNVNWNFDEDNMCTNLNEVNDKYTQYNIKDKNIFKKNIKSQKIHFYIFIQMYYI